jgi:predicted transcriptional regulator of viral defense system
VQSPLTDLLDAAERRGKLNLRTADIAQALPGVSAEALRQALHRQQRKGRIVRASRGSMHWVIVPLQDASAGAPPLETWLDAYLSKTLGLPYYVGLLSAAEVYGASPQAVMVTQVMTSSSRRPVQVGRHRLVFLKSTRIAEKPTRWHATPHGHFKISTPELTALDLVSRQQVAGGIARVTEVLQKRQPPKGWVYCCLGWSRPCWRIGWLTGLAPGAPAGYPSRQGLMSKVSSFWTVASR